MGAISCSLMQVYVKSVISTLCKTEVAANFTRRHMYMYMLISATIFQKYPLDIRLDYVRRYYNAISKHKINIPTPIMAGVRTALRQFVKRVLVDVDDSLDSIFSSDMGIGRYVAQRAGIGINAGRIRGINSKIRDGEVQHTGVVPFLKKSLNQLSDVAHKTASEVGQRLSTFLSGIKR